MRCLSFVNNIDSIIPLSKDNWEESYIKRDELSYQWIQWRFEWDLPSCSSTPELGRRGGDEVLYKWRGLNKRTLITVSSPPESTCRRSLVINTDSTGALCPMKLWTTFMALPSFLASSQSHYVKSFNILSQQRLWGTLTFRILQSFAPVMICFPSEENARAVSM